jgi:glycosyltransferase involved in cell wall biosynthesis
MEKIVTFAIAAYNSEKFLEKCLDAFLIDDARQNQIEVLIVSDGSKDRTVEIGKQYEQKYPEVFRVIEKENGGHGSVINVASGEAKGKYFKVVDADDWVETENLSKWLTALSQTDADVVLNHYRTYDIQTQESVYWKTFLKDYNHSYTLEDIEADWKSMDRCVTFHGITYRTEFYRKMGTKLAEKVFYEDNQYATIPFCYAESIQPMDISLYVYRIGDSEQSVSYKNQYAKRSHTETVLRQMAGYLADNESRLTEAGLYYYSEKLSRLLLSYLVIALLLAPKYRDGRREVRHFMKEMRQSVPQVCDKMKKRYMVLMCCSYLHLSREGYQNILESGLYNRVRGNKKFETN